MRPVPGRRAGRRCCVRACAARGMRCCCVADAGSCLLAVARRRAGSACAADGRAGCVAQAWLLSPRPPDRRGTVREAAGRVMAARSCPLRRSSARLAQCGASEAATVAPPPKTRIMHKSRTGLPPAATASPAVSTKQFRSRAMGQSVVVLGAQWGDEGKGKIVDLLTDGHRRGRALPGRPQRRPHPGHRRQEDRAAPDPLRHPARRRAVPDRQRRGAVARPRCRRKSASSRPTASKCVRA